MPKHKVGGGNLFVDGGLPDAELHLLNAEIVNRYPAFHQRSVAAMPFLPALEEKS